jgi:hypothetical protein
MKCKNMIWVAHFKNGMKQISTSKFPDSLNGTQQFIKCDGNIRCHIVWDGDYFGVSYYCDVCSEMVNDLSLPQHSWEIEEFITKRI